MVSQTRGLYVLSIVAFASVTMRSICRSRSLAALALVLLHVLSSAAFGQQVNAPSARPELGDPFQGGGRDIRVHPRERFKLGEDDEIATLDAIRKALSEVADGSTYVWYRHHGNLNGLVTPTSSFKDARGRVCRHILLILSAGSQTGRVEGVACRSEDGRWALEG